MMMLELLADLHRHQKRQGPGGDAETKQAIELAGLDPKAILEVVDIGCGTGAATLQLARSLNANITAVDVLPEFIEVLKTRAKGEGLERKIDALVASMEDLPFEDGQFDLIWSEGAIYSMGFERGVKDWKRFLKPGGILAVSEITWTSSERPAELENFWQRAYPEIDTASNKIAVLEDSGYTPTGYFVLPEHCWRENYYQPVQDSFQEFLARHAYSSEAQALIDEETEEIALYDRYNAYFSYGFYLAQKTA